LFLHSYNAKEQKLEVLYSTL